MRSATVRVHRRREPQRNLRTTGIEVMAVHSGSLTIWKSFACVLGGFALSLMLLPADASAAGTSTVVPITTFAVTDVPPGPCAGGVQSPIVGDIAGILDELSYPTPAGLGSLLPIVSLNPGCSAAPSLLSSLINASASSSASPNGSATVSAEALGNPLLAEQASAGVNLTGTVPLSAPASSVEVSIPYTVSGVKVTPGDGEASTLVSVDPVYSGFATTAKCADGSQATVAPFNETGAIVLNLAVSSQPDVSGTATGIRFYCPDGSDLVSGVAFTVFVAAQANAGGGTTESASVSFKMSGVTATVDS